MSSQLGEVARNSERGVLSWYTGSPPAVRRAFWGCKIGYICDSMDVQMLSLVVPTLITIWGISLRDTGLIGTTTLLASTVGGWGAGILADRIGRVRTLQLTILCFALFTGLCGLAQGPTQLLVARGLMGLGFGGEWVAGSILMAELVSSGDRGKAVGLVQAGWALGWGVAVGFYTLLFSILAPEIAWRTLFLIGVLPALLILFLRRHVEDSSVYVRAHAARAEGSRPGLLAIFSRQYRSITARATLIATGTQGGYYAIATWLPTYLKTERHLSVISTGAYLAVVIAGSYVGYVCSAFLCDRIGRKANFIGFAVASMIIVVVYTSLDLSNATMLWLGFPLGFAASGVFSGMGAFLSELYPTSVRGSGQGFCYNAGRAIGALFPFLIGALASQDHLGASIGLFAAVAYGLLVVVLLTFPETAGRDLSHAPTQESATK
ncbi:MFS transporter (plasmid) [Burkholderia sp. FERM BP-3421]|uniref:MFS transporter n=1 Tax=Burkholderia sp. FERM BP-3421 TaxID=1494466 RepID=UPI0023618FF9|nr:MFS transporter [Burkholderia sp. FERM BP-3421]WDD90254.1 MFS transporter [Burkholderia sp. FERM BP-3421]